MEMSRCLFTHIAHILSLFLLIALLSDTPGLHNPCNWLLHQVNEIAGGVSNFGSSGGRIRAYCCVWRL
jgi:hypothetical protein